MDQSDSCPVRSLPKRGRSRAQTNRRCGESVRAGEGSLPDREAMPAIFQAPTPAPVPFRLQGALGDGMSKSRRHTGASLGDVSASLPSAPPEVHRYWRLVAEDIEWSCLAFRPQESSSSLAFQATMPCGPVRRPSDIHLGPLCRANATCKAEAISPSQSEAKGKIVRRGDHITQRCHVHILQRGTGNLRANYMYVIGIRCNDSTAGCTEPEKKTGGLTKAFDESRSAMPDNESLDIDGQMNRGRSCNRDGRYGSCVARRNHCGSLAGQPELPILTSCTGYGGGVPIEGVRRSGEGNHWRRAVM